LARRKKQKPKREPRSRAPKGQRSIPLEDRLLGAERLRGELEALHAWIESGRAFLREYGNVENPTLSDGFREGATEGTLDEFDELLSKCVDPYLRARDLGRRDAAEVRGWRLLELSCRVAKGGSVTNAVRAAETIRGAFRPDDDVATRLEGELGRRSAPLARAGAAYYALAFGADVMPAPDKRIRGELKESLEFLLEHEGD